MSAFSILTGIVFKKKNRYYPVMGNNMVPDLSSSTRKNYPLPVFPSGEGMPKGQAFLVEELFGVLAERKN